MAKYVAMSTALSLRGLHCPPCFQNFCFDLECGGSALILTPREDDSRSLLRLITGIVLPEQGTVQVLGLETDFLDEEELSRLRRRIGVVPPRGALVSNLKMWENITLPLLYHRGRVEESDERRGLDLLSRLGYDGPPMALPGHLSLHQKRIAAMVRAIMMQPDLLVCCNCLEGIPPDARQRLLSTAMEYHAGAPDRTILFLESSPETAAAVRVDLTVNLQESPARETRHDT